MPRYAMFAASSCPWMPKTPHMAIHLPCVPCLRKAPQTCGSERDALCFCQGAGGLGRDGEGIEGSVDVDSGEVRVGRAMDCAIRTDDAMVSRHHSRVFWGGGGYILEDLQSANGVYFQEQRVQQ